MSLYFILTERKNAIKKLKTILSIILVGLLLVSCNNADKPNEDTTESITTTKENTTNEQTTTNKDPIIPEKTSKLNLLIGNTDTESITPIRGDSIDKFGARVHNDENAVKTRKIEIAGVEYSLTYKESGIMRYSDMEIHNYTIDGVEYRSVLFNAETGDAVKYINIPFNSEFTTEKDYTDFIASLMPASMDISNFKYSVKSNYNQTTDEKIEYINEDKFVEKNENIEINNYKFAYIRKFENVSLGSEVSATFYKDRFTMEAFDFKYDDTVAEKTITEFNKSSDEFQEIVFGRIQSSYKPVRIQYAAHVFFTRDGQNYIRSEIELEFVRYDDEDAEYPYTTLLTVITSINQDETAN